MINKISSYNIFNKYNYKYNNNSSASNRGLSPIQDINKTQFNPVPHSTENDEYSDSGLYRQPAFKGKNNQADSYNEFRKSIAKSGGIVSILLRNLQNNAGIEIIEKSDFYNSDHNTNTYTVTEISHIKRNDNSYDTQREYIHDDGSVSSWYESKDKDGNSHSYTIFKDNDGLGDNLEFQYEVISNDNGISEIIVTKKSKEMPEFFEITSYTLDEIMNALKDYQEDYGIFSSLKDGLNLNEGTQLSKISTNPDGSKTYTENIKSSGCLTKRTFTSNENNAGYNYTYSITDTNGNSMLDLNLSFSQNLADNKTITEINGKTYTAVFDDEAMTINVNSDNKTSFDIDINAMTNGNRYLYETTKRMPANLLITLSKNIKIWQQVDVMNSSYIKIFNVMESGGDISGIAHELGHSIDYSLGLHKDTDLISIYNSEIKEFNSKFTKSAGQNYIQYFSQTGGGRNNTGLNELIAETNILLTTGKNNVNSIVDRAQFLAQNFPKTISYIANKIGLNNK